MSEHEKLVLAKNLLESGNSQAAIEVYRQLIETDPEAKADAALNLGMIFEGGIATPQDQAQALAMYDLADKLGHPLAPYRLGAVHQQLGNLDEALQFFLKVAPTNPSAAYWCYRILSDHPDKQRGKINANRYLELAIEQGHLLAAKVEIMQRMRGNKGVRQIPGAVADYIRLYRRTSDAVASGYGSLYQ